MVRSADAIPPALHERGLDELGVGCNRLRCSRCREWVRREGAFYRCGCEERAAEDIYLERQRNGAVDPPHVPWRCAGHPPPSEEERRALGYTADATADVVERLTAEAEPHHPARHAGYAADLRLEVATAAERRAVYARLGALLDEDSAPVVAAAMDLLRYRGELPLDRVVERWRHFSSLASPRYPRQDLGSRYEGYVARLAHEAGPGSPEMEAARRLADELGDRSRYVRHVLR